MIKLNKRYEVILTLVFLMLISLPLYAGDSGRIGTAAGEQLKQPTGARDLAMGGANLVYTEGVDALYWNPAGLSSMESGFQAAFSRVTIFNDIAVNYFGLGVDMGSFGMLGFDIKSFDFGNISLTTMEDMDGTSGATFSPSWGTIGLTYANKLTSSIQIGVKANFVYESLPRVGGSAVAFDLGIQYKGIAGIEGVSFAVLMKNIGSNMQYGGSGLTEKVVDPLTGVTRYYDRVASSDQLPAYIEIGAAYNMEIGASSNVIFTGLFQSNNVEYDAIKGGIEYSNNNDIIPFAVRAGYVYGSDLPEDYKQLYTYTFGFGIEKQLGGTILGIDYAYRNSDIFDSNNMFTLHVGF